MTNTTHSIKSVGIIAEYNPLHNGHIYHINKTKDLTGADCVIVVMSGNFVQRGEPAIIDKYARARMALLSGADLVIELPVISATGSAQYFAKGAIGILNSLKTDYISFGSETGDITALSKACDLFISKDEEIDSLIKNYVAEGISYPTARANAFNDIYGNEAFNLFNSNNSNNILALEYMLELKKTNSNIIPVTVKREGNNYNDTSLSPSFSSATAIRNALNDGVMPNSQAISESVSNILNEYKNANKLVSFNDYTEIIRYKLIEAKHNGSNDEYNNIADLNEHLLNKLLKLIYNFNSIDELIEKVKTKDLTYTRISRALCHMLLNISSKEYFDLKNNPCKYIRVLGLNDAGATFLSQIKKECEVPIITKPADFKDLIRMDTNATDIYNLVLSSRKLNNLRNDYTTPIIKL